MCLYLKWNLFQIRLAFSFEFTSKLTSQHACACLYLFQRQPSVWIQCFWRLFQGVKVADADYVGLWLCVCVCVCDAAMSLLQSRSEAATQADLGQTLRVTVTFKNNLPQSRKIDNIFVTFSGSPFPALCEPLCSYLWREKDKDICVPTYLSISIFLSLTHSYCYDVGERIASAHRIWHRITHVCTHTTVAFISHHRALLAHAIKTLKSQIKAPW